MVKPSCSTGFPYQNGKRSVFQQTVSRLETYFAIRTVIAFIQMFGMIIVIIQCLQYKATVSVVFPTQCHHITDPTVIFDHIATAQCTIFFDRHKTNNPTIQAAETHKAANNRTNTVFCSFTLWSAESFFRYFILKYQHGKTKINSHTSASNHFIMRSMVQLYASTLFDFNDAHHIRTAFALWISGNQ